MDSTLETLKSIICLHLGCVPEDLELLTTFADLGVDSLDMIDLILACEGEFDIEIPEADANGIRTVAGLYDSILRAQGVTL